MTRERNKFGFLHYCFLYKFKARCSNLSCIILSCGTGLKKKKTDFKAASYRLFFSFCIFQLTDTVWIKSPTKTGGLEPAYLLKLLETLFDFGAATEGAWASADLRHKRQRLPRQADLVLPVMWVNLQFSSPFNSLEIRCWDSAKGVRRYAKPEGVCLLLSALGKAGWPCIIFLQLYLHRWGNNSVILERQTQWYTCLGASIEHSESCSLRVSHTISQSTVPTKSSVGKWGGSLRITLEDEKYPHIYSDQ